MSPRLISAQSSTHSSQVNTLGPRDEFLEFRLRLSTKAAVQNVVRGKVKIATLRQASPFRPSAYLIIHALRHLPNGGISGRDPPVFHLLSSCLRDFASASSKRAS